MNRAQTLAALARPPVGYWKTFSQPSWRVMGMFADAKALKDEALERTLNVIFDRAVAEMEREFDAHVCRALSCAARGLDTSLNLKQLAEAHRQHAAAIDLVRGAAAALEPESPPEAAAARSTAHETRYWSTKVGLGF